MSLRKPISILLFSDNYVPEMNANARIFSELSELWAKMGCDVSVITSHPNFPRGKIFPGYKNKWLSKETINKVNIFRLKTYLHPNSGFIRRSLDFFSFGLASFFYGLFINRHHIIIGVTPQFFCALSACLVSVVRKKPFLLVLCDLWPDSIVANKMMKQNLLYRLIKKLELWMYQKASFIAVLSKHFQSYLIQQGIAEKHIFLSISAPGPNFYPRDKNKSLMNRYQLNNKFTIGYLGTMGISHALDDVFIAADELKNNPLIHFLMIGDGARRDELQQRAMDGYLNIVVDGPVPGEAMPDYWSVIDIALVSLADTITNKTVLPSKILEAMAMGIPVILYAPDGEARRFLGELDAGWYVPVGDTQSLAKLIMKLAQDPLLVAAQRQKATEIASKYSREEQAKKIIEKIALAKL